MVKFSYILPVVLSLAGAVMLGGCETRIVEHDHDGGPVIVHDDAYYHNHPGEWERDHPGQHQDDVHVDVR